MLPFLINVQYNLLTFYESTANGDNYIIPLPDIPQTYDDHD